MYSRACILYRGAILLSVYKLYRSTFMLLAVFIRPFPTQVCGGGGGGGQVWGVPRDCLKLPQSGYSCVRLSFCFYFSLWG